MFPRAEWIEVSKYLLKIFNNEKKKSYSKKTKKNCHRKHRFFRNILRISQKMTKNVQKWPIKSLISWYLTDKNGTENFMIETGKTLSCHPGQPRISHRKLLSLLAHQEFHIKLPVYTYGTNYKIPVLQNNRSTIKPCFTLLFFF